MIDDGVFPASSAGAKNLADNTLRLQIDIEPQYAAAAYALFHTRGTPMGIARLVTEVEKVVKAKAVESDAGPETKPPEREHLGPLCWWAVQRCNEPRFLEWLDGEYLCTRNPTPDLAARCIKTFCSVGSRKDLDTNPNAARLFRQRFMKPYAAWLAKQGARHE